ncbi:signal transduction histidine-protein kinase BaeS [Clostridium homopropionicum DSM 5847]|uniref:histidine kinase n=1 Tax=Clostridium homopropionicum DSM 5847 TaxID=1121318 RepID=A0A0L6ZBK3_9CLOT|nr:HAMP domain-containing sensor histidine kinase [Clostridium homopropionicum]KOA20337.1 signal transduction histidine-protein kinase BaeS [Clostridium homopropionicum DSM 5847]SFG94026.1 Signal transduction histidine kinase [Clostridium homopropionicum]
MKKFDKVMAIVIAIYLIASLWLPILFKGMDNKSSSEYKVEINRIFLGLAEGGSFTKPDLASYKFIKSVSFLPESPATSKDDIDEFYKSANGLEYEIKPWYDGNKLLGYLRFNYVGLNSDNSILLKVEFVLFIFAVIIISVLLYVRNSILKPFNILSEMPYQLSKGNLKEDIKENKNRYFGKFVWGINVLRENLDYHKIKELKLEKEKKLLMLSISHDIKTPLNTIKLYAKAIEEEVYDTNEKKVLAAKQIQEKSLEIENFVKEIVKTSSEDILEIEVKNSEFYLKNLIDRVIVTYKEKCSLKMIDFFVEDYSNKLVKGDFDRALEVIGNIIENAFKYGDGKIIRISLYEEDYCQLIKIFNSGEIISQNEFNHIFDSFYRASNAKDKPGNGLGLYICKHIMEKMDGEIFAECERDGMSFTLVFR